MATHRGRAKQQSISNTCAWCNVKIGGDSEVYSLGTKSMPGIDLKAHEGKVLPLFLVLAKKSVPAIVVPEESAAKRDGYDIAFMLCSQDCAVSLREALQ